MKQECGFQVRGREQKKRKAERKGIRTEKVNSTRTRSSSAGERAHATARTALSWPRMRPRTVIFSFGEREIKKEGGTGAAPAECMQLQHDDPRQHTKKRVDFLPPRPTWPWPTVLMAACVSSLPVKRKTPLPSLRGMAATAPISLPCSAGSTTTGRAGVAAPACALRETCQCTAPARAKTIVWSRAASPPQMTSMER